MKSFSTLLILFFTAALFLTGCKKSIEYNLEPVPGVTATRVQKYKFEFFRKAPADRPFVKVAEVTAKTASLEKAKKQFKKAAKKVKGQAAVNIRAVKIGNYRGLSVHHWVADIVIWQ